MSSMHDTSAVVKANCHELPFPLPNLVSQIRSLSPITIKKFNSSNAGSAKQGGAPCGSGQYFREVAELYSSLDFVYPRYACESLFLKFEKCIFDSGHKVY